jgi:hypothetical protein
MNKQQLNIILEHIIDELEDKIYSFDWTSIDRVRQKTVKLGKIIEEVTGYRYDTEDNASILQECCEIYSYHIYDHDDVKHQENLIRDQKYNSINKFRRSKNIPKEKEKYLIKPDILTHDEFEEIENKLKKYNFFDKDNEYKFKICKEIIEDVTGYDDVVFVDYEPEDEEDKAYSERFKEIIRYVWMYCHNILNPVKYTEQQKKSYSIYKKNMKICENSGRNIIPKFTVDDVILKNFIDSYVDDPNWNGNLTFLEAKVKKRMIEIWRLPLDAQIMNVNTGEILSELAFDYIWERLTKAIENSGKDTFYE